MRRRRYSSSRLQARYIIIGYPQGDLAPAWLLLSASAALTVYFLANGLPRLADERRSGRDLSTWVRNRLSFWPNAVARTISWYGFRQAGIHPALGLLPIIPAIPHSDIEFDAEAEGPRTDLLNVIEHALKGPVQIVLFLFGLANAGSSFPPSEKRPSWFGLGLPAGIGFKNLIVLGCVAAIGFTVSLFVAGAAFPAGTACRSCSRKSREFLAFDLRKS